MRFKRLSAGLLAVLLVVLAGCGGSKPAATPAPKEEPKQEKPANPWGIEKLVIGFVPSSDAAGIETKVQPMSDYLSKELGVPVTTFVGTNYVGVVEAMGSKQVDVGFLNPLSYVLAHNDYGVKPILKSVRRGSFRYRAQLTVRAEDKIPKCDTKKDPTCKDTFAALKGKKVAFVDPASTSGYLYPASFMKNAGINIEKGQHFSDTTFAGSHDNAIKAVYNKTVDASWTFEDARDRVSKEFADVKEKLAVVAYTDWIPNDTVSVRKDLPQDLAVKLQVAFMNYASTPDGKKVLQSLYEIDNFAQGRPADYQPVIDMAKNMGIDVKAELTKPKK
ncbi:MAG: phosphate/phosphite/phosphonate ABC transporter substrate-binding protein [Bacillota bacterium]